MAKRKTKVVPEQGAVVAVQLSDESYGLAHLGAVFKLPGNVFSVTFGFYDAHEPTLDQMIARKLTDAYLEKPVFVLSCDSEEVETGAWPVIARSDVLYSNVEIENEIKGQMKWYQGMERPGALLLEMYLGLRPWDLLHDPMELDKILLPGFSRPPNAIFSKT